MAHAGRVLGHSRQQARAERFRRGRAERAPLTVRRRKRFERSLAEILGALGLDMRSPSTRETPRRMLDWLIEMTNGLDGDPRLAVVLPRESAVRADARDQIIEGPIAVSGLCEHHALPMEGVVYIGVVPSGTPRGRLLGLSKFHRIARWAARRFTIQERMTHEIAAAIDALIRPDGIAVASQIGHACTRLRGVEAREARTVMNVWHGVYQERPELCAEFRTAIALTHARGGDLVAQSRRNGRSP